MEMSKGWKKVMSFVDNAGNINTWDPKDETVCSTADIEHALYLMREMAEAIEPVIMNDPENDQDYKYKMFALSKVLDKFKEWK